MFPYFFYRHQALSKDVQFPKIERTLRKYKSQHMPKHPASCEEIEHQFKDPELMSSFGYTCHDEPRIFYKGIYKCDTFSYCVFASDTIIGAIQQNIPVNRRHYLMDATFKIVPVGPFTQLLIIYIEFADEVSYSFNLSPVSTHLHSIAFFCLIK